MGEIVYRIEKFVNCGEKSLGVSGTRMDEARVVGSVKHIFVLLHVVFKCQGVFCEVGFLGEPLKLLFRDFIRRRSAQGAVWVKERGKLIEAGGYYVIVEVDQVCRGVGVGGYFFPEAG